MNDTKLAFLKAIRKVPADDLPRLVYADWLEEHGEPEYAEYIRFAVAYVGELAVDLHPYRRQLEREIYGLMDKSVGSRRLSRLTRLELDRGFLSSIDLYSDVAIERYVPLYLTQCVTSVTCIHPITRNYTTFPSPCSIQLEAISSVHRKLLTPALSEVANTQGGWTVTESWIIPHGLDDPTGRNSYRKCWQLLSDAAILTLQRLTHESV